MYKRIIDKDAFDKLNEFEQSLYEVKTDGKYHIKVENDAGDELRAVLDKEKEANKALKARLDEIDKERADAKAAAEEAERKRKEEEAKKNGDIEALEKSWREKAESETAAERAKREAAEKALNNALVGSVANQMANEISTVPSLMVDVIKRRLKVEMHETGAITRVLDKNGAPSALSVDDLKKELVDNPEYKSIIKANQSSGGGSGGGGTGGGAPGEKSLKDMTATEEAAFANAHPERYQELVAAQKR